MLDNTLIIVFLRIRIFAIMKDRERDSGVESERQIVGWREREREIVE